MRLVAHLPQRCDNTNVRVRARADPQQFSERLPGVANGHSAFAKAGQGLDDGNLIDQVECGTRREIQHPRAQCVKIAGLAAAFNVPLANGGAWQYHNMHLQAGLANGGLVEMHYLADELYKQIYRGLPVPKDGWLTLPDAPGLGRR